MRLARLLPLLLLVAPSATAGADQHDDLPASHSVQPELYATGFVFAEGPAFDSQGNLYVVNYREYGTIGRIAADGTASVWCVLDRVAPLEGRRAQANGLKVDRFDRLIVADAGGGRVLRIGEDSSSAEVLADRFQGARLNAVNDVALDSRRNVYFTDPGGSGSDNPVGSVYRFDIATKTVTRVATGLAFPNGIGVTPDQKHLCVAESQRYRILIFDLAPDGSVGDQRVLIDFPQADQGEIAGGKFDPDGLIFDERGRLYVAMWVGGVINVVEVPSGKLLRQYDAGGEKATNVHFHGTSLFTTVAAKEAVFRLPLGVKGFRYSQP